MQHLLPLFGLAPGVVVVNHPLPGSPERAVRRTALRDDKNRLWMLEQLAPGQDARRQELGLLLAGLARQAETTRLSPSMEQAETPAQTLDLSAVIPAYRALPDAPGEFVLRAEGACWQLSPCVEGTPLPRPDYLDDSWRGATVAEFLLALWRAGSALEAAAPASPLPPSPSAQLARYRDELFAAIDLHRPDLSPRLARCRAALEPLAEVLAEQPRVLVHGDLHPLNILWGTQAQGDALRAVIDWEFAGTGPQLYDAANCLGCAGFEHPSAFRREFASGLLTGLAAGGVPGATLAQLPRMVLASRLGWLSEWLRRGDAELLDLELDYLDLLAEAAQRD